MIRNNSLLWIIIIATALTACSGTRHEVMTGRGAEGLEESFEAYFEKATEARKQISLTNPDAIEATIENYEKANALQPGNVEVLSYLGVVYYQKAYSFEDVYSDDERKAIFFKSKNYCYEALLQNSEFKAAMDAEEGITDETMKLLDIDYIGPMFQMASSWGRWGQLEGILSQAFDLPNIKSMVDRSLALDEGYYQSGPHRFFGTYFTEIPSFAGRSEEKSQEHFLRAIELAPTYLENQYMYARYYAYPVDDEKLYRELLEKLLEAEIDPNSEYLIEQQTAKKMARQGLEEIEDFF